MSTDSALSAPAAAPTRADDRPRPRPLDPLDGALVDASAVPFSWRGVPGAKGYTVQVAPTPAFDRDVLEVEAGPTTSLTIYGTLPERDADLYWRVRADAPDAPWSGYGRFVATHDDAVDAYRSEQDAAESERKKAAARQREERETETELVPHYAREESITSSGEAATLVFMLVSFVLTIVLLVVMT